jgi:hypothetical protein
MNNYKIYTTGEVIDLISNSKDLNFEAITGIYDGRIVSFNENMNWLMWTKNNSYEPISLNNDFMNTMWKVLSPSFVAKIDNVPTFAKYLAFNPQLVNISEFNNYCFIN